MIRPASITAIALLIATPAVADFSIGFSSWGNIPNCSSGNPNTVGNPEFILRDLPEGTETVEFLLRDLDVPNYNHGGARLRISGAGRIPFGTFSYQSPCPPGGVHTYEWTATARRGNTVLGVATASRNYPD